MNFADSLVSSLAPLTISWKTGSELIVGGTSSRFVAVEKVSVGIRSGSSVGSTNVNVISGSMIPSSSSSSSMILNVICLSSVVG